MSQVSADSFAYADSSDLTAVGSSWSFVWAGAPATQRPGVLSEQVYGAGLGRSAVRWNADTFADDQYAEATVVGFQAGNFEPIGLAVRCSPSSADFYYCLFDTTHFYLEQVIAGVPTDLVFQGTSFTAPVVIRIEVVASTFTIFADGVALAAISDSALTSGSPGIVVHGNTNDPHTLLDDWSGGDLIAVEAEANSFYAQVRSGSQVDAN